ncbi:response regulator [Rubrivirga sp.]|uniref:response regulator n=1 Tax=Rubrivirga sp. TaxID=1885344 RepID=UPI003B51B538
MPGLSRVRVLVADDSPLLRRLLRDAIEEIDRVEVVAEVGDGAAAVDGVRAHRPDVVVLDLQMPVLGGMAALQRLRADGHTLRVIVLTNHSESPYRDACLRAGADHFFDKSAGIDRVLDVVRGLAADPEVSAFPPSPVS